MADFKSISIEGQVYNVKDEQARSTANQANTTANAANTTATNAAGQATTNSTNITNLSGETLVVNYVSDTETVAFTKGVSL